MEQPSKSDRRQVTLGIPTDLYEELERYSGYLNLRVSDAAELAIANMVSQAKALGADWPLARPWMDTSSRRGSRPGMSSCARRATTMNRTCAPEFHRFELTGFSLRVPARSRMLSAV